MTGLDIAQRRLRSQQLIGARFKRPGDVVKWLGAVQAQDYAGAKWALGLRLPGSTDNVIEKAFAAGAVLRTHVLRPTWHFVSPADIRWMLTLTAPRLHAANAHMYRKLELDNTSFRRSNTVLTKALQGGRHLTRDELRETLQNAGIPTDDLRMVYLMMHAELDGVVCSGPRRVKQFTYALLEERALAARTLERADALVELARRFFSSRGPATVQDFAKWAGLTVADARTGLEGANKRLESETVDGKAYWFSAAKTRAADDRAPTAHLLSIYDEYISGYKDRSAIVDTRNAARLVALGNLLTNIVLVSGRVVGTWKRKFDKNAVAVKIDMFNQLTRIEQRAVREAVEKYAAFVEMQAIR